MSTPGKVLNQQHHIESDFNIKLRTTINTKYIMASLKPNSKNDMKTTYNPSGMRRIKATLNFPIN